MVGGGSGDERRDTRLLVLRGEDSDLLPAATLEEMRQRKHTETFVVPRTGHAPMLMDDQQVGVVRRFLLG